MEKKTRGIVGALISIAMAIGAIAGAIAVFYKVVKKHFKFTVEVLPEEIEDENSLTAAVDVVDIDIPVEEKEEDAEPEFEIAFTEEENETEA